MVVYYCDEFKEMPVRFEAIDACTDLVSKNISKDIWLKDIGPGKKFSEWQVKNGSLSIEIDHDESTCNIQTSFHCVYVIAVLTGYD